MALYFIYAAEGFYQGMHGLYQYALEEANSRDELEQTGIDMSYEVMESYDNIYDQLRAEAEETLEFRGYEEDEYENELEAALDEAYAENVYYEIIKLDPQYSEGWYQELITREGIESIRKYEVEE